MPSIKSAKKRLKQDKKRQERNVHEKSRMRGAIKRTRSAIAEGNAEKAQDALKRTCVLVDKAGKKNTIHPKTADRYKSRLTIAVNKISASDSK